MKVLAHLYGDYVFSGDIGEIARTLSSAVYVESEYKDSQYKYFPKDNTPVQMSIIDDSQFVQEEQETIEHLKKKLERKEKESSENWTKQYNAEQKIKSLETELNALRDVCPHKTEEALKDEEAPF